MIVTLKAKELGDLVRFLKRAKLIGTDYLIKNDMWIPRTRTPESRPGTHILRGYHPIVQDKVFLVKDVRMVIDALENVTGKKGMITISADYNGISITLRDGAVTIPVAFPTEEKFPIDANDFTHYLSAFDGNWTDFTQSELDTVKRKGLIVIKSVDGDCIRLSKSNFKLNGVEQAKNAIKYSGKYFAQVTNDGQMGNLFIHMDYGFFEAVHHYLYAVYRESDKPFDQL